MDANITNSFSPPGYRSWFGRSRRRGFLSCSTSWFFAPRWKKPRQILFYFRLRHYAATIVYHFLNYSVLFRNLFDPVHMAETTIPEELQKHDTTKELGKALESGDIKIVETAFKNMYDSIHVLVGAEKWLELQHLLTYSVLFRNLFDPVHGRILCGLNGFNGRKGHHEHSRDCEPTSA